jgi:predicted nucleotidyltransferase
MTALNELATRVPLLEEKYHALDEFLRRLKERAVWQQIAKVVLYGSVLRGDAGEESDIDVLIVGMGNLREVEEVTSDVAFSVLLDLGQRVKPLVYCPEDFCSSRSFLSVVRKEGKEVYSMPEEKIARLVGRSTGR